MAAVALLTLPQRSNARTFDWALVDPLDVTTNPTWLQSSLAMTPDGKPVRARLVLNRGIHNSRYYGDFRIDHYDAAGTLLWSGLLEGEVDVRNLRIDSAGAIVAHGMYRGSMTVAGQQLVGSSGSDQPFLLKLDADRDVVWLIDPSVADPDLYTIMTIAIDAQDRVWIGVTYLDGDTAVRRLNSDGSPALDYIQEGTIGITGLAVDPDGSVWAAGPTSSGPHSFNGFEAEGPYTYSTYLVRYEPDGTGAWVHFVEDVTFQAPRVASDGTGAAYFSGDLNGAFSFGGLIPEGIDWVYDFFLAKVDANGNFLWLREVPNDGVGGDAGHGVGTYVVCRGTESVYFCGFSRLEVDWKGDGDIPPSYGGQDVLVLEYSPDGDVRWAKTAGSDWLDIADAVGVDAAGNVYLAGQVCEDSRFDDHHFGGEFVNTFIASLPRDDTSSVDPTAPDLSLELRNHPNPFRPNTEIRFRIAEAGHVRMDVHDASGARVATLIDGTLEAGPHQVTWDGRDRAGRDTPSGVYFCRLESKAGVATRRMTAVR